MSGMFLSSLAEKHFIPSGGCCRELSRRESAGMPARKKWSTRRGKGIEWPEMALEDEVEVFGFSRRY